MTVAQAFEQAQPCADNASLGLGFDRSAALQYLNLLGKDPATAWFRTLHPSRERQGLDDRWINRQIEEGKNVYLVTGDADQATSNRGMVQDSDVTACRAFFVEWDDGSAIEEQAQRWLGLGLPEPTITVSTGGKSAHLYWVLDQPMAPAQWKPIQTALIDHCNGDKACKNPSRLMRLPGSVYFDKETGEATGRCQIIDSTGTRYSAAEIEDCIPKPAPKATTKPKPARGSDADLAQLLPKSLEQLARDGSPEGSRNGDAFKLAASALAHAEAAAAAGLTLDGTPEDLVLAFAARCSPPLEESEALKCLSSAASQPRNVDPGWPDRLKYHLRDGKRTTQARPKDHSVERSAAVAAEAKAVPSFEDRWEALELHAAELACSGWPVMKMLASLKDKSSELGISRSERQMEQLLEQAQKRIRAKAEPVPGGGTFTIKPTPWAVEGIFRHGLNLLTGQSGAGKSRLAAACMAAWLRGDPTWLQRRLQGDDPRHRYALIIGTDQNLEDWHLTLGPVGLTEKISATEVRVHDRLTLYSLETGIQLDADGLNTIRRWVDAHPGGMVLIDSLAQCLPPGVDEDKSTAARPVHQLQEVLGDAWGILTHHTRKGAGKEGNLGVGAGRGSGAIDAAVSRVVGLGLIHKMEGGQMLPQESDPRRELLSTKRGGKTEHLIISSDGTGFWELHGTAEALKARERQERTLNNLTEPQSDVMSAIESSDGWQTTRQISEAMGEEYDSSKGSSKAAALRKVLRRLESLGLIEGKRVGVERSYRLAPNHPSQSSLCEVEMTGSEGSELSYQGISLARKVARNGSEADSEPVSSSEPPEPPEPASEPASEPPRTQATTVPNLPNHPAFRPIQVIGSEALITGLEVPAHPIGSGADVMTDGDDPAWSQRVA